ncbi:hypothetical protein C5167_018712 [Papaver somniferum]|uniref:BHLH domain-containing protein n=1 Tax=Papaver somniferum TaxID=3469 RepID=A0A4Y7IS27_PAPSO|nr:hypothetical protein C5167_018712 [Papaver somniferum]
MKNLQELVPNASRAYKSSMLDEIIEYVKFFSASSQGMSKIGVQTHFHISFVMCHYLHMMPRNKAGPGGDDAYAKVIMHILGVDTTPPSRHIIMLPAS